jgi:hypothetical protein
VSFAERFDWRLRDSEGGLSWRFRGVLTRL